MKKFLALLCALILAASLFACAPAGPPDGWTNYGMLARINSTPEVWDEAFSKDGTHNFFYNDMPALLKSLKSGEIDVASDLPACVCSYLEKTDKAIMQKTGSYSAKIALSMGTLKTNTELFRLLNDSIKMLNATGEIEQMKKTCIDPAAETGQEPEPVTTRPVIKKDALVCKIGLSGDLRPVEWLDEEGNPVGFCAALLDAIGTFTNIQFEPVVIKTADRLTALEKGEVDALFCIQNVLYEDEALKTLSTADQPDSVSVTDAYLTEPVECLVLKTEQ